MLSYFLTEKVIEDLSNIWEYTFDKWSEYQADKYYGILLEDWQALADQPHLGKKIP